MIRNIEPHGGKLVNRILVGEERDDLREKAMNNCMKKVKVNYREIADIEMISIGAMSPLTGFMCKEDYENVIDIMRLANSLPWTIPVTLSATKDEAKDIKEGEDVALVGEEENIIAVLHLEEMYHHDKNKEALEVYGVDTTMHPGVDYIYKMGEVLLGGKISVINRPKHKDFSNYRLDPAETRRLFAKKGWKRIVGFQTRNPVHRAHEYIQKCALEIVDGILLHPLVGETKGDDIPADVRIRSYEVLLEKYYPKDRIAFAVFPAAMRYAGPREAIFHAILRKNYGCTHFIVGRDHAGVGSYYGSFDAHYIFDEYDPLEVGITPLFFDYTFYCNLCLGMASYKTCLMILQIMFC
ncbi:MAG: sulfate adenylyltransferase [Candidatus Scalindua rubra]|uniref:sulfate adenylyltransferase n=1 Tax=Candidatus Scalindua rubra TaxID=1872076 RepID=A0A1E3XB66_9BACT|nr:MAG: sulfate adenylyltransferase [Candidatus Scalindua rubra]